MMLLTPSRALVVFQNPAFQAAFKNVTFLTGAPVAAEGSAGYIGVITTTEDAIDVTVMGPHDEDVMDTFIASTEDMDEGIDITIEGSAHVVALFSRCFKKSGDGMVLSFGFEIDPFA